MHHCGPSPNISDSAAVVGVGIDDAIIAGERRIYDKGPHMAVRVHKRGRDLLDYGIDLRRFLQPGETVTAATAWLGPITSPALAIHKVEFSPFAVLVWLEGGKDGESYHVSLVVETSEAREKLFSWRVSVRGDAPTHIIECDGGGVSVGAGMAPELELDPPHIIFPATLVGQSSQPVDVTVTNVSAQRVTITSINPSAGFSMTSTTGGALDPGESFTLSITFSPSAAGALGGYVSIGGNAPTSVTLAAQGL